MKNFKQQFFLILLMLFSSNLMFSQNETSNFKATVFKVLGDLNKDGIPDLVIVKGDNSDKNNPYLLEIFFKNKTGNLNKVFSSTKTLMEKFPYGDERTELLLEDLQIKNGILIFRNQMIRGNFTHKFRFQNGNFELIGFSSINASPGYVDEVDYNLSTGDKIEKQRHYETDKILKLTKTKNKISPLPKLQDFTPFDFTY